MKCVDEAARRTIVEKLDENILVEAGAGSGKTTIMIERIVNLIENGTPISKICAITFTNASAQKMTTDLCAALEKRIFDTNYQGYYLPPADSQKRENDQKALTALNSSQKNGFFGTIDSFCLKILSRHKDELGFANKELKIIDHPKSIITRFLTSLETQYENEPLAFCGDNITQSFFSEFPEKNERKNIFTELMYILSENKQFNFVFPSDIDDHVTIQNQAQERKYNIAMLFCQKYLPLFEDYKINSSPDVLLTFNDCKLYVRNLLFDSITCPISSMQGKLRDEIAQRYSYYFVDEYQDTDPIQTEILFYLTSKDLYNNWREHVPAPGSLFMVGDPKQSIYSFRGAEPSLFIDIKEKFVNEGIGIYLELTSNFRSHKPIIQFFNKAFSEIFNDNPSATQCHFSSIDDTNSEDGEPVYLYQADCSNPPYEQTQLPMIINKLINEYHYNPSDILLITFKNTEKSDLLKYLNANKKTWGICDSHDSPACGEMTISNFSWTNLPGYHQNMLYDYFIENNIDINTESDFWKHVNDHIDESIDSTKLPPSKKLEEICKDCLYNFEDYSNSTVMNDNEQNNLTENDFRVSTLHSAKGLESKVVILTDTFNPSFFTPDYMLDYNNCSAYIFQIGKKTDKYKILIKTDRFPDIFSAKKRLMDEENDRLLYVATTRAQEFLFIANRRTLTKEGFLHNDGRWEKLVKYFS